MAGTRSYRNPSKGSFSPQQQPLRAKRRGNTLIARILINRDPLGATVPPPSLFFPSAPLPDPGKSGRFARRIARTSSFSLARTYKLGISQSRLAVSFFAVAAVSIFNPRRTEKKRVSLARYFGSRWDIFDGNDFKKISFIHQPFDNLQ